MSELQQLYALRCRRGRIVEARTPEDVARVEKSYTGAYFRELLARCAKARKQAAQHLPVL